MARVVHFDLPADDPERAIAFYEKALGWTFRKWDGPMEYWLVMTGPEDEPGIDGGLAPRESPEEGLVNIIDVADVDATVSKIVAAGGTVERPKMAIPGVGWLAYCRDTEGNLFGVMKDDPTAGMEG
jgi:predicted enzyme related to lactoylglutathione lyase